jgi:hypothetical protein
MADVTKATEDAVEFTHDDYKRALVAIDVHPHTPEHKFKEAVILRARLLMRLHQEVFGCLPLACDECKDEMATMRALDCDDAGNPNDA